jgi:hypothetical protein
VLVREGTLSATIDSSPLAVDGVEATYSAANVNIVAVSNAAPACAFFSILLWGDVVARGPAVYSTDVLVPEVAVLYALRSPTRQWRADALLGSGSLTVTSVTRERIAGTFAFELVPEPSVSPNAAIGTKVVANGAFDVTPGDSAPLGLLSRAPFAGSGLISRHPQVTSTASR